MSFLPLLWFLSLLWLFFLLWHIRYIVGCDEAVASAVYIIYLYLRIGPEELAQFGDIDIHAAGVEVVVVHPDGR